MLRPATPLSVLLFGAFVLLLISVLSVPIIKGIPLCTYQGVNFGVFGFCTDTSCSKFEIGYDTCRAFQYIDSCSIPADTFISQSAGWQD
jgi:hypothetical protein